MPKEKIFLMLTDLDNTITPTDEATKIEFANFAKKMWTKDKVALKLCPISGRAAEFVSDLMIDLNRPFEKVGLPDTIEMGAGDQGGVLAFRKNKEKNRPFTPPDKSLRDEIRKSVFNGPYAGLFLEEKGTHVINVFYINPAYTTDIPPQNLKAFFIEKLNALKIYLEDRLGDKIHSSCFANDEVGVLEVSPKNLGKDVAINKLFDIYQKKYDIIGMCYCGDHENDMKAINHMSKLAEVPGINTFVFLPQNAQPCTKNPDIKKWQDKMGELSRGRIIRQGRFDTLKGILDVMTNEYSKGNLLRQNSKRIFSVDDSATTQHNQRLLDKLNQMLLRKNETTNNPKFER